MPRDATAESRPRPRKTAVLFILITVFIDVLGIGIIVPVLPELVKSFVGGETTVAGRYFGLLSAVYALIQFLFAPVLGSLSDRFGRRPVLLGSLFGLGVDYLFMGFAPSIGWLFAGRTISGLLGASYTTANAYIADVSGPDDRARNFGLVGVAFGLGFLFGPGLGGLLGGIDLRLPFFAAAGLALVNWLYGFFVLPESLPPEKRGAFEWKQANPIGSLAVLRSYPLVAGLALAFVCLTLGRRGLETTWVLYTGYRYGWSELDNGLTLTLVGVLSALVQGLLVRPVIRRFGERRAILWGIAVAVLAYVGYGSATEGWMIWIIIVFASLSDVAGPAIHGVVAGAVDPSDQGKVQGGLTSLLSLTRIVAPLVFVAGLFSYVTSDAAPFMLPGAPFYLGAALFLVAIAILARLFRRTPEARPGEG